VIQIFQRNNPELRKHRNILFKVGGKEYQLHPGFIAVTVFIDFYDWNQSDNNAFVAPELDVAMTDDYSITFISSPVDCKSYVAPDAILSLVS